MAIFTRRYGFLGAILSGGVLVASAAGGAAAATTAAPARVSFGAGGAATATDTATSATTDVANSCETGAKRCVGDDPVATLAWSSAVATSGCHFQLSLDWGDGTAARTVALTGGAAGKVWRVTHTYPGGVAARHPYRIHAVATVVSDPQARGCSIESASVLFALECTGTQLSGGAWSGRFPGGDHDIADLNDQFRPRVTSFVTAMSRAGIIVQPQSTLRSPQRSYLMHFSYLVSKGLLAPQEVPAYVPLATEASPKVCWLHRDTTGRVDKAASVAAARTLLTTLGVDPSLGTPPALHSRHNTGDAIDMRTTWSASTIKVKDAGGHTVKISNGPRDGTNPALIAVGATYGVDHFAPVTADRYHWSSDGH